MGNILVDGFYDAILPLSDADRAQIAAVPFDEAITWTKLGVDGLFGERGYTPREQTWARPTLEINGIWGGFQGDGVKTVLPNAAHAKITCRLVADQEPEAISELIRRTSQRNAPPGVSVTTQPGRASGRPYLMPADHPGNRAAHAVLKRLYGREPYDIRTGGSIPVCDVFLQNLGVHTVNFGFGLEDEQIHAPDEFFRLSSFSVAGAPIASCWLSLAGRDNCSSARPVSPRHAPSGGSRRRPGSAGRRGAVRAIPCAEPRLTN